MGNLSQKTNGDQMELSFEPSATPDGCEAWKQERARAMETLARKLGLPLGHPVEAWLVGGVRLRGVLRVKDGAFIPPTGQWPKLVLVVDGVEFQMSEIESCVRTD